MQTLVSLSVDRESLFRGGREKWLFLCLPNAPVLYVNGKEGSVTRLFGRIGIGWDVRRVFLSYLSGNVLHSITDYNVFVWMKTFLIDQWSSEREDL